MATYSDFDPSGNTRRAATRARSRALLALVIALVAGLGAAWLVARTLAKRGPAVVQVPMKKLVSAKMEIGVAEKIDAIKLEVVEWPETAVPKDAVHELNLAVNRISRSGFSPGEPITEARLTPRENGGGLSALLEGTERAMTVRVTESSGVAGFVHPGDFVDVIATMQPRYDVNDKRSRMVLQYVNVLAVGEELTAQNAKPIKVPVVTLKVQPDQAEKLALASSQGEVSLVLRPRNVKDTVETAGISPPELFGEPPVPIPGRPAAAYERPRASGGSSASKPPQPTVAQAEPPKVDDGKVGIIRGSSGTRTKIETNNNPGGGR